MMHLNFECTTSDFYQQRSGKVRLTVQERNVRAVVQRVQEAKVCIKGQSAGMIGKGLLILLGVGQEDNLEDARALAEKVAHLRIFPDTFDKMNLSVLDVGGGILVISQFTLFGDCRKGRRPSYTSAAPPERAQALYEAFVHEIRQYTASVETGQFQAIMQVHLVNDGPVTLILDSRKAF
jgi:D-aminoacyl-tRNA deacylase